MLQAVGQVGAAGLAAEQEVKKAASKTPQVGTCFEDSVLCLFLVCELLSTVHDLFCCSISYTSYIWYKIYASNVHTYQNLAVMVADVADFVLRRLRR